MNKGEQTRLRILAEAGTLFNQHGYAGCSIQDVMEATGLEKGGIYRHFKDKDELAAEAFDFAWGVVAVRRFSHAAGERNAVAWLKSFIDGFAELRILPGGCPMLNYGVSAAEASDAVRRRIRRALDGWRKMLCDKLEQAKRQRGLRAGTDSAALAEVIIATLEGAVLLSRIERSHAPLERARQHLGWVLDAHAPARRPARKLSASPK